MRALKHATQFENWLDHQPNWVPWQIVALVAIEIVHSCFSG